MIAPLYPLFVHVHISLPSSLTLLLSFVSQITPKFYLSTHPLPLLPSDFFNPVPANFSSHKKGHNGLVSHTKENRQPKVQSVFAFCWNSLAFPGDTRAGIMNKTTNPGGTQQARQHLWKKKDNLRAKAQPKTAPVHVSFHRCYPTLVLLGSPCYH